MHQFSVDDNQIGKEYVTITGADVNHIRNVLRMKIGEKIRISSGNKDFFCSIAEVGPDFVQADILDEEAARTELPSDIYLFQAIPKGDRMETVIEKAVELGVHEIIPVAMKYCVVKLDEKKADAKIKRWQGIAEAAAKQSKRGVIPTVAPVMSYVQAVKTASEMDLKLVPYELAEGMPQTKQLIESARPGQQIAIFIGPEGGFDPEEIRLATEAGIQPITLGKRILRTETAGFTTIAWLMYQLEN